VLTFARDPGHLDSVLPGLSKAVYPLNVAGAHCHREKFPLFCYVLEPYQNPFDIDFKQIDLKLAGMTALFYEQINKVISILCYFLIKFTVLYPGINMSQQY